MKRFFVNGAILLKLIEIAILVILLPLFSVNISRNLIVLHESQKTYQRKAVELSRAKTITNGFKTMCQKSGVQKADFDKFSEDCKNLFGLDSILIETIGIKDNKKLLKCTWCYGGRYEESYGQCGGL